MAIINLLNAVPKSSNFLAAICAGALIYSLFSSSNFFRYAIGGLSGGEAKDAFWRVVAQCTAGLPEDKPRYVMVYISTNFCFFFGKIRNGKGKLLQGNVVYEVWIWTYCKRPSVKDIVSVQISK